ncbi:thiol-disulfide oxidoreductase DCC family protein [Longirhabdus pacifica]|uniref:thiol-disulfide oxidoreductase DCC family protein n=1 Tax=Longirhabdus pacifica TaxID=2305227 RepID=UPI001008DA64|nr:thiol-disulfide oxidoreductase DCC family protein [Longirhabdus pacifica]
MRHVILFDGECHLCNTAVQFIIKRDPKAVFSFAALQSDVGKKIIKKHNISDGVDSLILIYNDKCYIKSSAALTISKHLKGLWKGLYFFIVVPKPIRDYGYGIVAKNRYKWFGKRENCMVPTEDIKKRFIH